MIHNFFKIAIRNVLRQKSYALISIINLSVGMACFILIMLWVQSEISINKCFQNADHIYLTHKVTPTGNGNSINAQLPYPYATAVKNEIPEVQAITRVRQWPRLVTFGEKHFYENNLVAVDTSYFEVFQMDFVYGDANTALRENKSIVLTENIAQKYFGNENPINQVLEIENTGNYVVSAVVKKPEGVITLQHELFIPIDPLHKNTPDYNDWFSHFLENYIYAPAVKRVDSLDRKITRLYRKYNYDVESKNTRFTEMKHLSVANLHLYNVEAKNQRIQYVYIFSLIGILILIVSCINYMNIATSISERRSREIGLKKVVGAFRKQLSFQFLVEALIQVFVAMLVSMMIVELLRPFFNELSGKDIFIPYLSNWFIPVIIILIIVTTLLAGSYPAFLMSSFKPIEAFRGKHKSGKGQTNFRKILVIFQFSVSITLIVATLFIYLQLNYINNKELGFDKENILYDYLNDNITKKYESFRNELLANLNVVNVARGSQLPNNINYGMRGLTWVGKEDEELAHFNFAAVDEDYVETLGLEMLEGRDFSRDFSTDGNHYVMNEAAIKMMNFKNPVGRQFQSDDTTGRVLGVMKDFNSKPLTYGVSPLFFIMVEEYYTYIIIKIRPENKEETVRFIANVWNSYSPLHPFETRYFSQRISGFYKNEIRNSKLALAFTVIILLITSIGLFGLASHTAQKKTKEIGVRKVFGASVFSMVYLFVKMFFRWVLISNVIAWPVAYYFVSNWLDNYVYRVKISVWVFWASAALAIMISIITVGYQSYRAATRNPIDSLRYE